jgi:glutamyl-Q tRNA(Asp) synthetase
MYIGRFAPSPTGPLHFGSLVAAVASFLDARSNQGKWLLRMEDLDKPREVVGAATQILKTLESYGFEWDDDIIYQSQRIDAYEHALSLLKEKQMIYPCTCTRREIADSAEKAGLEGSIYPKTCLTKPIKQNHPIAWRMKTDAIDIVFEDSVQGEVKQNLSIDIGDFILKRADGLFAYQLAVVVDDAAQGINKVVRGADLLLSTPRQIYLQNTLNYTTPAYMHIPVVTNEFGQKLSKQTLAHPISDHNPVKSLWHALHFLNQDPLSSLQHGSLTEAWSWAVKHWQPSKINQIT